MSKEWSNPYNPFNSFKVLLFREHLDGCVSGNYLIPPAVDIDPSNVCNYKCFFCNATNVIDSDSTLKMLPEAHLLKLSDFVSSWGKDTKEGSPKSVCVGGGGEPFTNPATPLFLERNKNNGLESGVITNGSLINSKNVVQIVKNATWIGVSVDAGTASTYAKVKGVDSSCFEKVKDNLKLMVSTAKLLGIENNITYKFLLSPENAYEIYDAVKVAKECGVSRFQLRPAGYLNVPKFNGTLPNYTEEMLEQIDAQIDNAMALETENFKVFGVRHKLSPDFQAVKRFSRCWAIPLVVTFNADGNVYMCFDIRGRKNTIMAKHYPDVTEIARFWNTDAHREMVKNYDISSCPRCTIAPYQEIIEQCIIEDGFTKNFL